VKKPNCEAARHRLYLEVMISPAGQSMVEFLVILPVALLLILGAIQFALIYHAKTTLNYAAFEAARYGSLDHAKYEAVQEGFARGLAPLYSYFEPDGEKRKQLKEPKAENQVEAFQIGRRKIFDEFNDSRDLIRIERLSPTVQDFSSFAVDEEIPNDNLMYRASKDGHRSGRSIQDANLLHLRITYWYPLYIPMVNQLIFGYVCNLGKYHQDDTIRRHQDDPVCIEAGAPPWEDPRIPLRSVAVMRMQSPAENSLGFYIR